MKRIQKGFNLNTFTDKIYFILILFIQTKVREFMKYQSWMTTGTVVLTDKIVTKFFLVEGRK